MNEWVEDPARDLLKALVVGARTTTSLTRAQQMHLSKWLAKTSIMMDAYWGSPSPRAPREEVNYFFRWGMPSLVTTIWVGQLERNFMGESTPQNVPPKPELIAKIMTAAPWSPSFSVYKLFSLFVSQPPHAYRPITLPVEAESCLTRIWPPHEDVTSWPPPEVIDRPTYDALRRMVVVDVPWSPEPGGSGT
jgi:hypothetical protein